MKKIFLVLIGCGFVIGSVALPQVVAAGTELKAVGARDAAGARVDDYKIVDGTGSTRAEGRFEKGKMEGKWSFFDTHHVKVAEITYHDGAPSGPYKTYFGSRVDPAAAGKLESEGTIQNGALVGNHTAYDADGKVTNKAVFENGTPVSVDQARAKDAAKLDLAFIQAIDEFIRPALR